MQFAFALVVLSFCCYTVLTRTNQVETAVPGCILAFSFYHVVVALNAVYVVSALAYFFCIPFLGWDPTNTSSICVRGPLLLILRFIGLCTE